MPGYDILCPTLSEAIHVYDKLEQSELIVSFKFFHEQFHTLTSQNKGTNSATDHSLQVEHTSDGAPSMSISPYQLYFSSTGLKELA